MGECKAHHGAMRGNLTLNDRNHTQGRLCRQTLFETASMLGASLFVSESQSPRG